MRKILSFLLISTLIAPVTSSAQAADELAIDPISLMSSMQPATSARGIVFYDNLSSAASVGYIRYSQNPKFRADGTTEPGTYWNWNLCSSWDDSACPLKEGFSAEGNLILGKCLNETEIGCLEDFQITNADGSVKKLTYLGPSYKDVKDIPEQVKLGIPRSSSQSIYSDDSGNLYVIRANVWMSITGVEGFSNKLDVDVIPVVRTVQAELKAPEAKRFVDSRTNLGYVSVVNTSSNCASTDVGICYKAIKMDKDLAYQVKVRVPNRITGWLRGRVSRPEFDVKQINENSQVITVKANPATVPIAGGWINFSDLPANFLETLYPSGGYDPSSSASYMLIASPSQGEISEAEYRSWSAYLKEKALVTLNTWTFGTNLGLGPQACMYKRGQVTGFVTSNASVYSSMPPTWDAKTSTLTYKVGAPHFDENGKENLGTYTLAMPLSTIQCLYNQSKLPPSATVSISYGSEEVSVATVTLKSDSGWVYFNANGFHFSSPNIQVKFAALAEEPVVMESAVTPPVAPKKTTTTTITCLKGKVKKKVTAMKPTCPKGYKRAA